MSLNKNLEKKIFDKRLVKWNMRSGKLTQAELDQHIGSLEDESANAGVVSLMDTPAPAPESEAPVAEPTNGHDETASALNGQYN